MPRPADAPRADERRRPRPGAALLALGVTLALVAGACSTGSDDAASDDTTADQAATETTTTLPPCEPEDRSEAIEPVGSEASGTLVATAAVAPGPHSVLTGVVEVTTAEPATVTVVATSDRDPVEPPATELGTDHEVALLGLHAETDYDVAVTATTDAGETETLDLTFTSGSLPADLPHLDVTVSEPDAMAAGITLFVVPAGADGAPHSNWLVKTQPSAVGSVDSKSLQYSSVTGPTYISYH